MVPLEVVQIISMLTLLSAVAFPEKLLPKVAVVYTSQHSALVSWPDTGTDSNEYLLEYGPDWLHSNSLRVSKKTNTVMIHRLKPDTLYTVRVRNAPTSDPGPPVRFRTKPIAVSVFAPFVALQTSGVNKLRVTWGIPAGLRPQDVVHFSLVFAPLYSPYFRKTILVLPGNYKSFLLEYLRPDTVYKVKIAALLKTRKGPYSAWALEKTGNTKSITTRHGSRLTTPFPPRRSTKAVRPATSLTPENQLTDLPGTTTKAITETLRTTGKEPVSSPTDPNRPTPLPSKAQTTGQPVANRGTRVPSVSSSHKGLAPTREVATEDQGIDQQNKSSSTQPSIFTRTTTPAATTLVVSGTLATVSDGGGCQDIHSSMCSDNGYHSTKVRLNDQQKMNKHVEDTWSRLSKLCKNQQILKQFICAVNFPFCSVSLGGAFLPCRSMCVLTKKNCDLENYAGWPPELDCENFPTVSESKLCIAFGHNMPTSKPSTTPITLVTESAARHSSFSPTRKDPGETRVSPGNVGVESTKGVTTDGSTSQIQTTEVTSSKIIQPTTSTESGEAAIISGNGGPKATSSITISKITATQRPTSHTMDLATTLAPAIEPRHTPRSLQTTINSMLSSTDDVGIILSSLPTTTRTRPTTLTPTSTESHENGGDSTAGHTQTAASPAPSTAAPPTAPPTAPPSPPESCETLRLRICNGAGYNMIQFPNYFNQTHQNDAARGLFHYWPLVEAQCSPKLALFLCSLYAPVCTKSLQGENVPALTVSNILPCRSICKQVSRECGTLMKMYKYTWPEGVDCEKLPEEGEGTCIHGNTDVMDSRDLVTFAEPVKQTFPSNKNSGINGCQELSAGHVCRKYYLVGALSNTSKSFRSVDTAIRNRQALVKDFASKKCIRNLELLMCSMYVPKCSKEYRPQPPCRSQCRTTLRRCNGALKALDVFIPELNNCRQFPQTLCTGNNRKHGKKRKLDIESI